MSERILSGLRSDKYLDPRFGKVDMRDIQYVARRFGTNSSSLLLGPAADIISPTPGVPDGKIDMRDIGPVQRCRAPLFGAKYDPISRTIVIESPDDPGNTDAC